MPYISESEYSDYVRLKSQLEEIEPHVEPWLNLLGAYLDSFPRDVPVSYAGGEFTAMLRVLLPLFPKVRERRMASHIEKMKSRYQVF